MKRNRLIAKVLVIFMLLPLCVTIIATPAFAAGDGSYNNPYIITSQTGLKAMESNGMAYYKLGGNFTVTSPIGTTPATKATGYLDGNGYTITLSISSSTDAGLFGYAGDLTVQNLNLNGSVTCNSSSKDAGAVVGYSNGSVTIINCYSSVKVTGNSNVGGLVGHVTTYEAYITNCTVTGTVSGTSWVGGMIGKGFGYFYQCSTSGRVTGSGSQYVGGIAGYLSTRSSRIIQCEAKGNISGGNYVGGIVGYCSNTAIENCYTTGNISGSSYVGGIAGDSNDSVYYCYSTSSVVGSGNYIGGIVGFGGYISSCFALNSKVERTSTNASTAHIGRVGGSPDSCDGNSAINTMVYKNKGSTVTPDSYAYGKDGLTVQSSALAHNSTEFKKASWSFPNIWISDSRYIYPILRHNSTSSLRLDPGSLEIVKGSSADFNVVFDNTLDSIASCVSSNPSIATVSVLADNTYLVTGNSVGETTIIVTTVLGFTSECKIKITPVPAFVQITSGADIALLGSSSVFTAVVTPDEVDNKTVIWTCDHPSVTISPNPSNPNMCKITIPNDFDLGAYGMVSIEIRATHSSSDSYDTRTVTVMDGWRR